MMIKKDENMSELRQSLCKKI